jgi:hypothetical protein
MKQILREPLLHFLALGAALFAAYSYLHRGREATPGELVVSAGQIEHLAARFTQFQQRPPSKTELKGLIDQYVREEILSREAVKLGLDQDDTVIRRHLQQKMEFVATDLATAGEPNEAELADWLAQHPDKFRHEPQFTFRHVYLDPDKHGDRFEADAAKLLADLKQAGVKAESSTLGDSFLLPHEFVDVSQSVLAVQFGPEFTKPLAELKIGEWTGPIRSGYGAHLVLLTARSEGHLPALDEVRDFVRRDLVSERRQEVNRRFLEGLLSHYQVKIEWPREDSAATEKKLAKVP